MNRSDDVRLLVIDDQEAYCDLIRDTAELCAHNFHITCEFMESGEGLLEKVSSFHPTVVLVDAHIPDMQTFAMVRRLADEEVPVIVTSEHRSLEIENSARDNGAVAYVPKADNLEDVEFLLSKIAEMADRAIERH